MTTSSHIVIGTAGHVDHGKTLLIKALTGIDTDRLAEEKKRGITIENGFAHLALPSGKTVGIIDVPGHEKFIHNMLAGSYGIDIALLVVAADDGVMPQTREHLDILRLLGIKKALVALTKCDLPLDPLWLNLVQDDISLLIRGVFENDPAIIRVSALSGTGISALLSELAKLTDNPPKRKNQENFRLPVDRVFTMTGFGTVVTGTLQDGSIKTGETVMVYPARILSKIKKIEIHGCETDQAFPGQRTAINLGLKKNELFRGDVLASPDSLTPSLLLDVRLFILPTSPFELKNNQLVHLYLGAKETRAKAVLINDLSLKPGQSGYCQLKLSEPLVAKKNDRFVIRFYSPLMTIGGGQIIEADPLKKRRFKPHILHEFEIREKGTTKEILELAIQGRPGHFESFQKIIEKHLLDPEIAKTELANLVNEGSIYHLTQELYIHKRLKLKLWTRLFDLLSAYHANNPHKPGLSLEEARSKLLPGPPSISEGIFKLFEKEKLIHRTDGYLSLFEFVPKENQPENELMNKLETIYLELGYLPPANSQIPIEDERLKKNVLTSLVKKGSLITLGFYHIHKSHYNQAWQLFRTLAQAGPVMTGSFRDSLNCSRKMAIALLESFDLAGLSRKNGEGRECSGKSLSD